MKLAYRLLLIAGHTLGDLALPLMKRQCDNLDTTMDTLSPAEAEKLLPALERVLGAYMARPADLKQIMHEMRLEVGAERFSRGELQPRGVEGRSNPGARSAVNGETSAEERTRTQAREEQNGGSPDPRKG